MLREGIEHLDFVLLTHEHVDHTAGMDDIRSFNFAQHKDMDIYANSQTCRAVTNTFAYAFTPHKYPGVPQFRLHPIGDAPFHVQGIKIIPIHVLHLKMPVLGYRISDMAYITDASFIAEKELEKLHGLKVLVLDVLRKEKHYSHFCLAEGLELVERLRPEQAFSDEKPTFEQKWVYGIFYGFVHLIGTAVLGSLVYMILGEVLFVRLLP